MRIVAKGTAMRHQDVDVFAKQLFSRRSQRLTALGRCLAALVVYVGMMALLILPSHAFSREADNPVLMAGLMAWWVGFPLMAGLWVRSVWWVPMAWLGPLLLYPVELNLGGDQAAAFFAMGAFFTALVGVGIGRWRFDPDRERKWAL
jgi:hypothetical protein